MKVKIGKFFLPALVVLFFLTDIIAQQVELGLYDARGYKLKYVVAGTPFNLIAEVADPDQDYTPTLQQHEKCMLLERSTRTQMTSSGGQQKILKQYIFTLRCDEVGPVVLGPIVFQGPKKSFTSGVFKFEVQSPKQKVNEKAPIFLQAIPEKTRVYVGEKVPVHVSFYSRNPYADEFDITFASGKNPAVELVGETGPQHSTQKLNSGTYNVLTWQLNVVPRQEGRIVIPAIKGSYVEAATGWFFLGFPEAKATYSDAILLDVLAVPPHKSEIDAVGSFSSYTIEVDKSEVEVGQAVVLKFALTGVADFSSIKALKLSLPEQVKYFEAAKNVEKVDHQEKKIFEYVLQPKAEGVVTIPVQAFKFFDPNTEQFRLLKTEPLTITVKPSTTPTKPIKPADSDVEADDALLDENKVMNLPFLPRQSPGLPGWLVMLLMILSLCWAIWRDAVSIIKRYILKPLRRWRAFTVARIALKAAQRNAQPDKLYEIFVEVFQRRFDVNNPQVTEIFTQNILVEKGVSTKKLEEWKAFFSSIIGYYFSPEQKSMKNDLFNQARAWINELEKYI